MANLGMVSVTLFLQSLTTTIAIIHIASTLRVGIVLSEPPLRHGRLGRLWQVDCDGILFQMRRFDSMLQLR